MPALLRLEPRLIPPSRRAELYRSSGACRTVPEYSGMIHNLFDRLLPSSISDHSSQAKSLSELLAQNGFDPLQHEQIQSDVRSGRIGLAQNRLPVSARIEDVNPPMSSTELNKSLASCVNSDCRRCGTVELPSYPWLVARVRAGPEVRAL